MSDMGPIHGGVVYVKELDWLKVSDMDPISWREGCLKKLEWLKVGPFSKIGGAKKKDIFKREHYVKFFLYICIYILFLRKQS